MDIEIKALIVVIVLAVIGAVGWDLKSSHEQIGELKTTITTQTQTIKNLNSDKAALMKVAKIDSGAQSLIDSGTNAVKNSQAATTTKVAGAVADTRAKYAALSDAIIGGAPGGVIDDATQVKLALNMLDQTSDTSAARLDGVWDAYCHAEPDEADCKPPPPTPPAPAAPPVAEQSNQ